MYRCKKTDCLMRSAERSMKGSLRCNHCESGRTDASPYIVYVSAAYPTPTRRDDSSSRSSSSDSGGGSSSWSSGGSSSDSGGSFSGGGGDAGGGGSSDSF